MEVDEGVRVIVSAQIHLNTANLIACLILHIHNQPKYSAKTKNIYIH